MTDARPDAPVMPALHARIMNLPCKPYDGTTTYDAYCRGHRDARHAAADLALREGSLPDRAETEGLGSEGLEPGPKDAPKRQEGAAPAEGVQPAAPTRRVPGGMSHAEIRAIFLRAGFTIKPGLDDLKDYVYKAAVALLEAHDAIWLQAIEWGHIAATPQAEAAGVPDDAPDQLTAAYQLGELLAIIHRDGGHYAIEHGWKKAVADAHEILAAARDSQAPAAPAAPVDAQDWSAELTRAKRLLVDVWQRHPDARSLIEARTGSWFVWGQDRAALSRPQAEPVNERSVVDGAMAILAEVQLWRAEFPRYRFNSATNRLERRFRPQAEQEPT